MWHLSIWKADSCNNVCRSRVGVAAPSPLHRLPLFSEMEMPLFLGRVALVLQHLPPLLQESGVVHNRGVWTIKNGKEVKINEQKSKQGERNVSFHIKRVVQHLKIHLNIPYYCRWFKVPLHTYEAGKHFPSSAIAWQCCFPVMQISMVLPWQVVGQVTGYQRVAGGA